MNSTDHNDPPQTIKEVGIHIGYMREDIQELKELVRSMPTAFATKGELEEVKSELHERINHTKAEVRQVDRRRWAQSSFSALFGAILTGLIGLAFYIIRAGGLE